MAKYTGFIILGIVAIFIFLVASWGFSLSNKDKRIRNEFKAQFTKRTAFYDNMVKSLSQGSQIALRNDSSFRQNVQIIMDGRKDAQTVMMKWIQETNPNANYSDVKALYEKLFVLVESKRNELNDLEDRLADIKLQSDVLLDTDPSGWMLKTFFDRDYIPFKPITSTRTDNVIQSGKDDDVKLF